MILEWGKQDWAENKESGYSHENDLSTQTWYLGEEFNLQWADN